MGWFYGFKLHLIINHKGEILATRNMKPRAIALWDKIMLKKRFIIETVNEQLKNITQIEHSRHRSVSGFMLNLIGSLIAYCHKKDKLTIRIDESDMKTLCI